MAGTNDSANARLRECWDHDLDGWCPLCHGDPDRCPRTARKDQLATEPEADDGRE